MFILFVVFLYLLEIDKLMEEKIQGGKKAWEGKRENNGKREGTKRWVKYFKKTDLPLSEFHFFIRNSS